MSSSSARHQRTSQPGKTPGRSLGMRLALAIFGILIIAAPLLFGGADRISQAGLLLLLSVGVLAQPPAVVALSRWGNRLILAFIGIVLLKEFAPASFFGGTLWRTILTRDYALELPWTHHPEPGCSFDALLAGVASAVWFLWVRRLAADRENLPVLAWSMFASAVVVSAVSFMTRGIDPKAIYGLRYTPGWTGFGPFTNRNHTADFLAMGAMIGCGCIAWAGIRKKWVFMVSAGLLLGFVLVALLTTESRGGLIAFALGLVVYFWLVAAKVRKRRTLGIAAAAALGIGGLALAFGAPLLARFHAQEAGIVSNAMRVNIWKDTLAMWKDAPLLGHGLDSFAQIFPLFQKLELENQVVLHPESSWLQWLVEFGIVPVLIAAVALAIFLRNQIPIAFGRDRSFYLCASGIAAAAVLLMHSVFDVPAHRWGTAGLALAALALGCPMRTTGRRLVEPRPAALIPLGVGLFWTLPFWCDSPAWSPLTAARLLARELISPTTVSLPELEKALKFHPLDADLHQALGIRQVQAIGLSAPAEWQRHFAIAARLLPSSWGVLETQARACASVSPGMAISYWQTAVERGGAHREEVLRRAVEETSAVSPTAEASWGRYAEANPHLLLTFARLVPEAQARYYFALWWKDRAFLDSLSQAEVKLYYLEAPRLGNRAQFDQWMTRHAAWRARDFRKWAALLHAWGDENLAWDLLSEFTPEPDFPNTQSSMPRQKLEAGYRIAPKNMVNAQLLATTLNAAGEKAAAEDVIVSVAAHEEAPQWFNQKASYILWRKGRIGEAVALMLRETPPARK